MRCPGDRSVRWPSLPLRPGTSVTAQGVGWARGHGPTARAVGEAEIRSCLSPRLRGQWPKR